jgi:hypothetical protein
MNESAVRPGGGTATAPAPSPSGPRSKGPRRLVELVTEYVYRLASSTLATPKVAVGVSLAGIAMVMVVGILSPNFNTLVSNASDGPVTSISLPLSNHLFKLAPPRFYWWIAPAFMYVAVILQCLGLAGLLWANSRGWRPNPRHLFFAACVIVAIMVNITPVGSSDLVSYAAYGHMANRGDDPYAGGGPFPGPKALGEGNAYYQAVAAPWRGTPSVYGPLGTWVQQLAAWIGGNNSPTITVWCLMVFNGLVFLAVGYYLLKTADDPVRATLMWVANPVLIQQLVAGGHLDTYTAAATVIGIQLARSGKRHIRYLLVGVAIGVACSFKINAGLVGAGVGYALLMRRDWLSLLWLAVGGIGTTILFYSYYGLHSLSQLWAASDLVASPSIWRALQLATDWAFGLFGHEALGQTLATAVTSYTWPILMVALAVFMYRRFSSDQPAVVIVPFVLCFAWVVVAPWNLPWYSAVAWVILALVPRNPMTRWLTLVTAFLALSHASGGGPVSLSV